MILYLCGRIHKKRQTMKRIVYATLLCLMAALMPMKAKETETPRIVNIINFIRGVEPRDNGVITPEILYRTVEEQAKCLRKNDLTGTYLLMYVSTSFSRSCCV